MINEWIELRRAIQKYNINFTKKAYMLFKELENMATEPLYDTHVKNDFKRYDKIQLPSNLF